MLFVALIKLFINSKSISPLAVMGSEITSFSTLLSQVAK